MARQVRVAICAPVYQRLALTRIWWHGIRRLRMQWYEAGLNVQVYIAGDEHEHRRLAQANDGKYLKIDNGRLGAKYNLLTQTACHKGNDYVFFLGSDDFVCPRMADIYAHAMKSGEQFLGASGAYFYEPHTGRLALFEGYPEDHKAYGQSVGAARLYHRSLLEPVDFRPWQDTRDRGLDANATRSLGLPTGRDGMDHLVMVGRDGILLDVKTHTNIWHFDRLAEVFPLSITNSDELDSLPEWPLIRDFGVQYAAGFPGKAEAKALQTQASASA